jgi:hypothetical protein
VPTRGREDGKKISGKKMATRLCPSHFLPQIFLPEFAFGSNRGGYNQIMLERARIWTLSTKIGSTCGDLFTWFLIYSGLALAFGPPAIFLLFVVLVIFLSSPIVMLIGAPAAGAAFIFAVIRGINHRGDRRRTNSPPANLPDTIER